MTEYVVYWLFDASCTDPAKHGYVGVTYDLPKRLYQHRRNKRFPKPFEWSVLFKGTLEQCLERETELRSDDWMGWNKARGGQFGGVPAGYKFSQESIERRRGAQMGHVTSEETKQKIAASLTGHTRTDESRAKQSTSAKGRPKSAEWRAMMSKKALERGGFFKGTHDEATQAKMREAQKRIRDEREAKGLPRHPSTGRTWTAEEREKLTEARRKLIYPGSPTVLKQQASRDAKRDKPEDDD